MGKSVFKTILLIDDDQVSNFIHKNLLEKMEIADEVKVVSNGHAGLRFLHDHFKKYNNYPDLILLDINMPVMDGKEFLKEFNAHKQGERAEVKIGILTVSTHLDDKNETSGYGAEWYINKPLTKEKVWKIIEDELN